MNLETLIFQTSQIKMKYCKANTYFSTFTGHSQIVSDLYLCHFKNNNKKIIAGF